MTSPKELDLSNYPKKADSTPKANPIGRPSMYDPKYADMLIEYFDIKPTREIEVKYKNKKGEEWSKLEEKANPLPTFEGFAASIGVDYDTILGWRNATKRSRSKKNKAGKPKYPEFVGAYTRAKTMQKNILIQNGLNKGYDSRFAQFVAKNATDMRDKVETDITSGGKPLPTPIMAINPDVYTDDSDKEN